MRRILPGGGVLNEVEHVAPIIRATEFYAKMDPERAVRLMVHASLLSDTTLAALITGLPSGRSEEIFKRLPPGTALRVSDILRRQPERVSEAGTLRIVDKAVTSD